MAIAVAFISLGGCQVLKPTPIQTTKYRYDPRLIDSGSQIEIGSPQPIIDTVGWVVGIPNKILLWDRRIDNHKITEPTIDAIANYLESNNLPHVKVRMNQYAPLKDFKRLRQNTTVAWPYRYSLGIFSLAGETLLPGRVFGGDHYNPYTQTAHIYSDVPSVALHEAAHAKDFSRRKYQGTYALAYGFVPLWHETIASREVYAYLFEERDTRLIAEADRILNPAYMTYVGSAAGQLYAPAAIPMYYGGVLFGHINGRWQTREMHERMAQYEAELKHR